MNKSNLVTNLSKETALTKQVAEEVIDTVFEAMSQALVAGEGIEIRGLGSFVIKDYKTYQGRNPKTGQNIDVSAKKLPFFKAGKELKERINSKKP